MRCMDASHMLLHIHFPNIFVFVMCIGVICAHFFFARNIWPRLHTPARGGVSREGRMGEGGEGGIELESERRNSK